MCSGRLNVSLSGFLVINNFVRKTMVFYSAETSLREAFDLSPSRTFEQFLLVNFEQFSSQIEFRGISNDDFINMLWIFFYHV